MTWAIMGIGSGLYVVVGALLDAAFPGLDLLGLNLQALAASTLCLVAVLWVAVRLDLLG